MLWPRSHGRNLWSLLEQCDIENKFFPFIFSFFLRIENRPHSRKSWSSSRNIRVPREHTSGNPRCMITFAHTLVLETGLRVTKWLTLRSRDPFEKLVALRWSGTCVCENWRFFTGVSKARHCPLSESPKSITTDPYILFFKISFYIILPFTPQSSKWNLPFEFSD